MKDSLKALLAVLFAVFIWGSTFLFTKIALNEIQPVSLAFLRMAVASIVLLVVIFVQGKQRELIELFKKKFFLVFSCGVTGFFLYFLLQNFGLEFTSSSMAGILVNCNPIIIAVLAFFFLKESLTKFKIFGLVLGFLGIVLLLFSGGQSIEGGLLLGNILLLLGAFSWAVYSLISKPLFKEFSPLVFTFATIFVGMVLFLPLVFLFENPEKIFSFTFNSWAIIFYLGFFASALAFFLWNYGVSKIEVSKAGMFLFFNPVFALVLGVFFLKEEFTLMHALGVALIFAGIYLSEKK